MCKHLLVQQKFDSGRSCRIRHIWALVYASGQPARSAYRMRVRRLARALEGFVRTSKVPCPHWMGHAHAGWPRVRPWVPGWASSAPSAAKISLSGFCLLIFYSNLWYVWLQTLFGQNFSFKFWPGCLNSYNFVQNFNITKLSFSWTFNQTNAIHKS